MNYFKYKDYINRIYRDSRWETYFDLPIVLLFDDILSQSEYKIVSTHATRKGGRHSTKDEPSQHFIDKYSYVDEEDGKRKGIPDDIIVPLKSTYDAPESAITTIEVKAPKFDGRVYKPLVWEKHKNEISHQLQYVSKVVLTDTITWFFLIKTEKNEITKAKEFPSICLYDSKGDNWLIGSRKAFDSKEEEALIDALNISYDRKETVPDAPEEWRRLKKSLKTFCIPKTIHLSDPTKEKLSKLQAIR